MTAAPISPTEESQLLQTIEMFEVIIQSQPSDTQSLEILKEAYSKLAREEDVIRTSKRIAEAYMQQGQLSSAILEYETVLQRRPDDRDVHGALRQIEDRASSAVVQPLPDAVAMASVSETMMIRRKSRTAPAPAAEVDDGRKTMRTIFVDGKLITAGDFDLCWRSADLFLPPKDPAEPFIQTLQEKGIFPIEKSLRLLSEKSRVTYLPLERYETDIDLARGFPAEVCRRWSVLPFDRMSKAILVATANPFNQQAAKELADATPSGTLRLLWYVAAPNDLIKNLRKAFR